MLSNDRNVRLFFLVLASFLYIANLQIVQAVPLRRHDRILNAGILKLCDDVQERMERAVANLTSRNELAIVAHTEKLSVGAELGVQSGVFAKWNLQNWPSNRIYYLVDLWAPQTNYSDIANVDQAQQERIYNEATQATALWPEKRVFKRMMTSKAAAEIPDNSVDFVYVDARHDYCGAKEDIELYWSKVKPGGIFAGHDYYTAAEQLNKQQDWSICQDGTVHPGAVKGAVDEFFTKRHLKVYRTREAEWYSWVTRKPLKECLTLH